MKCPLCKAPLVLAVGPKNARIGIVGEFPGEEELDQLKPFVGKAGDVLRKELVLAGIQIQKCRLTNLWGHAPDKSEAEYNWHFSQAVKEVRGCQYILVLGSSACEAFLNQKVSKISGLWWPCDFLPKRKVMATVNPANLFYAPVGEFRLALRKFAKEIHRA